jgi:hypothetical protein
MRMIALGCQCTYPQRQTRLQDRLVIIDDQPPVGQCAAEAVSLDGTSTDVQILFYFLCSIHRHLA